MSRQGRWLGFALLLGTVIALTWLGRSLGIADEEKPSLQSDDAVTVRRDDAVLAFLPPADPARTALIFIGGSEAAAEAYAGLLRPVATAGHPVFIVRLPYRRAFLHIHQPIVFDRIGRVIAANPEIANWVLAGHSLGGALSVRFAYAHPSALSGLVLIATTAPKQQDLSGLGFPVSVVYATRDGMAAVHQVLANRPRLPPHTRWIEIRGGNHAQFGRYENPLADGEATISREEQEELTRAAIIHLLAEVDSRR